MPGGPGSAGATLLSAVADLRRVLDGAPLPLDIPGAEAARQTRGRLLDQLDDYVLPRLSSMDAPVLAVVGGSTGAGKSTLVNSLVGREVSSPGVLRPTTRSPVLIHHPDDASWFTDQRILPGLARVTAAADTASGVGSGINSVRLVATDAVGRGLALLDAPDIDSVVSANRDLAAQLLAAADLWIFVTTAARYADAVPWDLLREAGERGTSVAIVLDRVPADVVAEISTHLSEMLTEQGLGSAPIFAITESSLERGLLPSSQTDAPRRWLDDLAGDAQARAAVIRQTLRGALESLDGRVASIVTALEEQSTAVLALTESAEASYRDALSGVTSGMQDGTLLRGEVLARWQEFVGTGEFFRQVESTVSRLRDRITSFFRGEPPPSERLGEALQTGVAALIANNAELAAGASVRLWRSLPGGSQLLAAHPTLLQASPDLDDRIERLVRDWQGDIFAMVREEGKDRRVTARLLAYGVNGLGLTLILVAFASTAGLAMLEVGIAGGTAVAGQKVLEAVFGDQAVRDLARKARERLFERVEDLYASELERYEDAVLDVGVDGEQSEALASAADAVRTAR
ncbi:dynamin family protein [Naasia lichenicola]|uniref:ABC transporter n=1 Tax=Naasia lichenicola TaxID=2565933 RepID=A0A4S4FEX5_9MICO|nr:dynamin family protein [Naasia lichenicola]THG28528.1 ABC transporter [Naasia lichenicola]